MIKEKDTLKEYDFQYTNYLHLLTVIIFGYFILFIPPILSLIITGPIESGSKAVFPILIGLTLALILFFSQIKKYRKFGKVTIDERGIQFFLENGIIQVDFKQIEKISSTSYLGGIKLSIKTKDNGKVKFIASYFANDSLFNVVDSLNKSYNAFNNKFKP